MATTEITQGPGTDSTNAPSQPKHITSNFPPLAQPGLFTPDEQVTAPCMDLRKMTSKTGVSWTKYVLKLCQNTHTSHESRLTRHLMDSQCASSSCHEIEKRAENVAVTYFFLKNKKACECKLSLFQDADADGDLADTKTTSGGMFCIFGDHTLVPMSWAFTKQKAVSHRS